MHINSISNLNSNSNHNLNFKQGIRFSEHYVNHLDAIGMVKAVFAGVNNLDTCGEVGKGFVKVFKENVEPAYKELKFDMLKLVQEAIAEDEKGEKKFNPTVCHNIVKKLKEKPENRDLIIDDLIRYSTIPTGGNFTDIHNVEHNTPVHNLIGDCKTNVYNDVLNFRAPRGGDIIDLITEGPDENPLDLRGNIKIPLDLFGKFNLVSREYKFLNKGAELTLAAFIYPCDMNKAIILEVFENACRPLVKATLSVLSKKKP